MGGDIDIFPAEIRSETDAAKIRRDLAWHTEPEAADMVSIDLRFFDDPIDRAADAGEHSRGVGIGRRRRLFSPRQTTKILVEQAGKNLRAAQIDADPVITHVGFTSTGA